MSPIVIVILHIVSILLKTVIIKYKYKSSYMNPLLSKCSLRSLIIFCSSLELLTFFILHLFQPIHIPHVSSSSMPAGGFGGLGCGVGGVVGDSIGAGGVSPVGGIGVGGFVSGAGRGRPLNLKMKFVCGQCWREGQVNEPDKNLKYCTAKARHR